MAVSRSTTTKMAPVLFLFATIMLAVEASSSARFLSSPAFYNTIESKPKNSGRKILAVSLLQQQLRTKMISVRGGAKDEENNDGENDDKGDDAVETIEDNSEDEDSEDEDQYDETEDGSSNETDYYDDETDEEEEDELASQLKKKSSISDKKDKSSESFVEPYFVSPSLQMYTTFGTILLSRKIDMFKPSVVRLVRTLFVAYLVVQQAFIFYVRINAKRSNDRTPIHVQNPLTSMLSSQLEKQSAGANDMVKNLASSFLKTETTVAEYDMAQARNMQGGILFNVALMWFLHFKMQQVQPLLVTSINGLMQLAYNPLFQVYVLGRNLERPFKSPEVFKDPRAEEESTTTETTAQDGATDAVTENGESNEVEKVIDEDSEDESSDDEDEDSSEDVEDDEEEVEETSDEEVDDE